MYAENKMEKLFVEKLIGIVAKILDVIAVGLQKIVMEIKLNNIRDLINLEKRIGMSAFDSILNIYYYL